MLIEKIIEFESRVPGRTYIPKTGYFHDKTKLQGKSWSKLFNAKNAAKVNIPSFP